MTGAGPVASTRPVSARPKRSNRQTEKSPASRSEGLRQMRARRSSTSSSMARSAPSQDFAHNRVRIHVQAAPTP